MTYAAFHYSSSSQSITAMNDSDDNSSPGVARGFPPRNDPASKHDEGNDAFWMYDPMQALREKLRLKLTRMKEARLPVVFQFVVDMRRSRRANQAAKRKRRGL
ncbi:hypothetical protein FisN_8Lh351 [Fistulifera solaris]|uniref:Uncharacterized protein n=1 Tax=Fistulifera solaris TaxID=1519565 RepID=A0A1Z5JNM7_FISSO|nr:hypothetical protein FisN_8Lh351 [Fistulifera solaris]|eukprot:GAX15358.1 hypothetical protein FisN_8Lh351 [Fistulifera solaris]